MLGVFLAGCVVGALVATLLTHADVTMVADVADFPLSPADLLLQIKAGWARPLALGLALLRHPLLLAGLLGVILATRRGWRNGVLRWLWIRSPNVLKSLLEAHSSLLGATVVLLLLVGSVFIAAMGAGPHASEACATSAVTARGWLSRPHVGVAQCSRASDKWSLEAASSAIQRLWPALRGLLIQATLPFAIHPGLLPGLIERLTRQRVDATAPPTRSPTLRWLSLRSRAVLTTAYRHSLRVRRILRLLYGGVLLLSVLWLLPITLEAGVRWWREEVLVYVGEFSDDEALVRRAAAIVAAGEECGVDERGKAAHAALALRTLAHFAMLRRIGKAIDLQVGHYYRRHEESPRPAAGHERQKQQQQQQQQQQWRKPQRNGGPLPRRAAPPQQTSHSSAGGRRCSAGWAHRWLKSYVRSVRPCITPPTYLLYAFPRACRLVPLAAAAPAVAPLCRHRVRPAGAPPRATRGARGARSAPRAPPAALGEVVTPARAHRRPSLALPRRSGARPA